jgi:hypothetical protein
MLGGNRPTTRVLAALAIVTACTLAFQVVFTRLMSTVMAYHFSFLAVSLALLGTGAGALLVYVRPDWFDGRPLEQNLARWSTAYAVLLVAGPFVLVRLSYAFDDGVTVVFALNLTVACLVAAAPSLAAGAVVALAIRGYADWIGRVYAWDLVGAGVGALAIVPLMHLPAPSLLVGLGVAAGLAAALFAVAGGDPGDPGDPGPRSLRRRAGLVGLGGVAALVLAEATSVLYLPTGYESITGEDEVADVWHPLSRVQAYPNERYETSLLFYDRVYAPVPCRTGRAHRRTGRSSRAATACPIGTTCGSGRPASATS